MNPNPRVGCRRMRRGRQAAVEAPGTNEKRYLAGSIHRRPGRVFLTEGRPGEGRGAALFLRHLDDLRQALRHCKVIHVISDNARAHKPERRNAVRAYLAGWGHRVALHYLPAYAPQCDLVARVWWRLHVAVTRNHRCQSVDDLLELTFDRFAARTHFRVGPQRYRDRPRTRVPVAGWRELSGAGRDVGGGRRGVGLKPATDGQGGAFQLGGDVRGDVVSGPRQVVEAPGPASGQGCHHLWDQTPGRPPTAPRAWSGGPARRRVMAR
jgi:hypothetical protein